MINLVICVYLSASCLTERWFVFLRNRRVVAKRYANLKQTFEYKR